jgi:thiamine-phosphate pyrophosphorylase
VVGDSGQLLVAIADTLRDGLDELIARSQAALECGATTVHLRLKGEDSRTLLDACRALVGTLAAPVIVHDRADVAVAARAAGVHLSPDEMPAAVVRRLVPAGMLVGASVGSVADLARAGTADYVSIGPVFGRGGKADEAGAIGLEEFSRLARMAGVPVVAVGGIGAENARAVLEAGAAGVAVITGAYAKAEAAQAIRVLRAAIGT